HRVHHAVNDRYLDRNYGGILMVWDRLFGSFQEEDERCVYGTRAPLDSWDPLWSNLQVYALLVHDSWHARRWRDKLAVWFKPPGWRPADVAERFPRAPFALAQVRRWDPPMTRGVLAYAFAQFAALLAGTAAFLWWAHELSPLPALLALAVLATGLWSLGAVMQGRIGRLDALALQAMALATAAAALGLQSLYQAAKPAALGLLIAATAARGPLDRFRVLLLAGLACSLAGDVLLLSRDLFLPGLLAFLLAHACYIALFRDGAGWLPRPRALAATLGAGALAYAVLLPSLGPVLRIAVAAYIVVIATMAAQALGRAAVLGDGHARRVAAGALLFMASDTLLAFDRFVQPLPLAPLAVLGTYYAAQWLIARHARATVPQPTPTPISGAAAA
ncbi:MAG: lysoplasmalogenase family protein, partial [Arenimonas sp.]|nr:lysoplasmalogenase family protein [Arenimonas sp.]